MTARQRNPHRQIQPWPRSTEQADGLGVVHGAETFYDEILPQGDDDVSTIHQNLWLAGDDKFKRVMQSPGPHDRQALLPWFIQPTFQMGSPEVLATLFHNTTMGVLSVKDTQETNPWRIYIWPFTMNNPALNHAIAAMTCLHLGKSRPELHPQGLKHITDSIKCIKQRVDFSGDRLDAAIAEVLALSLARS